MPSAELLEFWKEGVMEHQAMMSGQEEFVPPVKKGNWLRRSCQGFFLPETIKLEKGFLPKLCRQRFRG